MLRADPGFAGAISSLWYRGMEYVNADDHGRLFQGAIFFNGLGECENPTLAGAARDRSGRSTSRLLSRQSTPAAYAASTQMAYYRRPGEECVPPGRPKRRAANRTRLSDVAYDQLHRFRRFGPAAGAEATIRYRVAVERESAVVEPLTIYTPPAFDRLWRYDRRTRELNAVEPRADVPEQPHPLVLATADGASAVAFLADPAEGVWPSYSATFFGVTSKLNVVHRRPGSYDAGVHEHRIVWLVGTVEEVHAGLDAAAAEMHVARAGAPAMKLGR